MSKVETFQGYESRTSSTGKVLKRTHSVGDKFFSSEIDTHRKVFEDPNLQWWMEYMLGAKPTYLGDLRKSVRTVDLFSGSGGLALGIRQACLELGFRHESLFAVDQDSEATEVHSINHKTQVRSTKSVSELVDFQVHGNSSEAKFLYDPEVIDSSLAMFQNQVDVLLAGPPCQGHSNLNNKTRRTDKRNSLYLTVPAIAVALNVNTLIIENVPAVVHDSSNVVGTTIKLLNDAGYKTQTGVFKAHEIGWPQTRQRFFLVASKVSCPIEFELISKSLSTRAMTVVEALADLSHLKYGGHLLDEPTELTAENERRIKYLFDSGTHNLPVAERPDCHKDGTTYGAVYGRMHANRPAPTLTTGFISPGRGRFIHPLEPRMLTPREAARIQGFPLNYLFNLANGNNPGRTKLAKWIGDAVPMPLGYAAALSALLGFAE
jgi:DNA (cytosine-5)-methyltransferase 1